MKMQTGIALVGCPNCGKTTLFNSLTGSSQHTGNWPGVTVDKKEGRLKGHAEITVTDLPGIYSLSPYSLEGAVTEKFLHSSPPDVMIDVIDGTAPEKGIYLALQLTELSIPMVIAISMADIVKKYGGGINTSLLSEKLGCPACELPAPGSKAAETAAELAVSAIREKSMPRPPLENSDSTDKRHAFASKLASACFSQAKNDMLSRRIDRVVTSRVFSLPIFAAVMFFIYYISVTIVGSLCGEFLDKTLLSAGAFRNIRELFESFGVLPWLASLVTDGIFRGVGTVLGFVPQISALFLLLAFFEECGYMPRVAFIFDRAFRRFGLSGKSFIPLILSTGCGVPGIMACRTIESERERKLSAMTVTFMPCSAKLPLIALIAGSLFGNAWWVAPCAYFMGIAGAALSGILLKDFKLISATPSPFFLELPAYRLPKPGSVLKSCLPRVLSFVEKAGSVILLSSVAIWFLSNFSLSSGSLKLCGGMEESMLADFGRLISPLFAPLGWNGWQASVATLTGLAAKENIVGTLAVLYSSGSSVTNGLLKVLAGIFTPLSGLSFLIFNLLCAPCAAAVSAMGRELQSVKLTAFALCWQTFFAYCSAFCVFQLGSFVNGGKFTVSTLISIILVFVCALKATGCLSDRKHPSSSAQR